MERASEAAAEVAAEQKRLTLKEAAKEFESKEKEECWESG